MKTLVPLVAAALLGAVPLPAALPPLAFPSLYWRAEAQSPTSARYTNPLYPEHVVTVLREATNASVASIATEEAASLPKRGATHVVRHDETVCGGDPAVAFTFDVVLSGTKAPSAVEEVLVVHDGTLAKAIYFRPAKAKPAPGIHAALRTGCPARAAKPVSVGFAPPRQGLWVERDPDPKNPGTRMYESEQYADQRIALYAVRTPQALADYVRASLRPTIRSANGVQQREETICAGQPAVVLSYTTAGSTAVAIDQLVTRVGETIVSAAAFRPLDATAAPGVETSLRSLCPSR